MNDIEKCSSIISYVCLLCLFFVSEVRQRLSMTTSAVEAPGTEEKVKGASIAVSTFNLAKSIVGAGVLSLPSAVAFFSDDKLALIPSSIICAIFGFIAAYSFSLIGKACEQHKATSFQEAWSKSVDPKVNIILKLLYAPVFLTFP